MLYCASTLNLMAVRLRQMSDVLSCPSGQVADANDDDVRAVCQAGAQPVAVSPVHLRPPVISALHSRPSINCTAALPRRRTMNMHMHACSRVGLLKWKSVESDTPA